jgi:hypothetical protein
VKYPPEISVIFRDGYVTNAKWKDFYRIVKEIYGLCENNIYMLLNFNYKYCKIGRLVNVSDGNK